MTDKTAEARLSEFVVGDESYHASVEARGICREIDRLDRIVEGKADKPVRYVPTTPKAYAPTAPFYGFDYPNPERDRTIASREADLSAIRTTLGAGQQESAIAVAKRAKAEPDATRAALSKAQAGSGITQEQYDAVSNERFELRRARDLLHQDRNVAIVQRDTARSSLDAANAQIASLAAELKRANDNNECSSKERDQLRSELETVKRERDRAHDWLHDESVCREKYKSALRRIYDHERANNLRMIGGTTAQRIAAEALGIKS